MANKIIRHMRKEERRRKRTEELEARRPSEKLSKWRAWPLLGVISLLILCELYTIVEVEIFKGAWLGVVAAFLALAVYLFWYYQMSYMDSRRLCERLGENVMLALPFFVSACIGIGCVRLGMCVEDVPGKEVTLPVIGHGSSRMFIKGGNTYYLEASREALGHDDSIELEISWDTYIQYERTKAWPEKARLEYHENSILAWGKMLHAD